MMDRYCVVDSANRIIDFFSTSGRAGSCANREEASVVDALEMFKGDDAYEEMKSSYWDWDEGAVVNVMRVMQKSQDEKTVRALLKKRHPDLKYSDVDWGDFYGGVQLDYTANLINDNYREQIQEALDEYLADGDHF